MLHDIGMQTDPVLISPLSSLYDIAIPQQPNDNYFNHLYSPLPSKSETLSTPNEQDKSLPKDHSKLFSVHGSSPVSKNAFEKMARRTRQRLIQLIKKSGVDASSFIGRFAARVELVHPNKSFDQKELPTPPFSPGCLYLKENRKNCSEGAQLLIKKPDNPNVAALESDSRGWNGSPRGFEVDVAVPWMVPVVRELLIPSVATVLGVPEGCDSVVVGVGLLFSFDPLPESVEPVDPLADALSCSAPDLKFEYSSEFSVRSMLLPSLSSHKSKAIRSMG